MPSEHRPHEEPGEYLKCANVQYVSDIDQSFVMEYLFTFENGCQPFLP